MTDSEIDSPIVVSQQNEYYGYKPLTLQDLPYDEDIQKEYDEHDFTSVSDSSLLRDIGRTSTVLLIFMLFCFLAFVVLVVWLALISKCDVSKLCDLTDASSEVDSEYSFKSFEFLVPSKLIWTCMTIGALGLFVASYYAFSVVRRKVGSAKMVEIAGSIRNGSSAIFREELYVLAIPLIVLFLLIGFGINWRTAGSFALGALLAANAALTNLSIAARGNVRTAAAAHAGLRQALNVAHRSGAVIGVTLMSLAIAGISAVYIMFDDVRALAGFAAGSSTYTILARVGGGLFSEAADFGADFVQQRETSLRRDNPENPLALASHVGEYVRSITGEGSDLFESLVCATAATAILGSFLPFFYRNQFAMCVYNHLYVDDKCGPFGNPQALSYAAHICKTDNFYFKYPLLSVWQSNAAFVAMPFLVGAIGVLTTICTSVYIYVKEKADETGQFSSSQRVNNLLRSFRIAFAVASIVLIAASAGLCFGLFGNSSSFHKGLGLGNDENMPYFDLSDDADACEGVFFDATLGVDPLPLPRGEFRMGKYRPKSTMGYGLGNASQTAWRLFVCMLIGLALGVYARYISEYLTSSRHSSARYVADSGEYGPVTIVLDGLGIGSFSTAFLLTAIVIAVFGSHSLYGAYGVGITTVGMLSMTGVLMALSGYESVSRSANCIAQMSRLSHRVRGTTNALEIAAKATAACSKGFASTSSFMTSLTLILTMTQESGLFPSPRELVGTPTSTGSRFFDSGTPSSIADVYIAVSVLIGLMVPFLFGGILVLSVSRLAKLIVSNVRTEIHQRSANGERLLDMVPNYKACIRFAMRSVSIELVLPCFLAVTVPLVIGFGFGQKALIAFLLSVAMSAFLYGTTLFSAGGLWDNAKLYLDDDRPADGTPNVDTWTCTAELTSRIGDPMKDYAGPFMNALMKLMASYSLVVIPLMEADNKEGWRGAILLSAVVLFGTAYCAWVLLRAKGIRDKSPEDDETGRAEIKAPPKKLSPFFVAGVEWDPESIAPGSQMHEALGADLHGPVPVDVLLRNIKD